LIRSEEPYKALVINIDVMLRIGETQISSRQLWSVVLIVDKGIIIEQKLKIVRCSNAFHFCGMDF
jgi:hypothetical protein